MSRTTCSPVATRLSARVVGTPRWCIASLHRNSRTDERSTARPSARARVGRGPGALELQLQAAAAGRSPRPGRWPARRRAARPSCRTGGRRSRRRSRSCRAAAGCRRTPRRTPASAQSASSSPSSAATSRETATRRGRGHRRRRHPAVAGAEHLADAVGLDAGRRAARGRSCCRRRCETGARAGRSSSGRSSSSGDAPSPIPRRQGRSAETVTYVRVVHGLRAILLKIAVARRFTDSP